MSGLYDEFWVNVAIVLSLFFILLFPSFFAQVRIGDIILITILGVCFIWVTYWVPTSLWPDRDNIKKMFDQNKLKNETSKVKGIFTDYTNEELRHYREVFRKRRSIRISIAITALSVLIAVTLLAFPSWELFGMPKMAWAPFFYLLMFGLLILIAVIWRCPACNGLLGDVFNTKYCPQCGMKFQDCLSCLHEAMKGRLQFGRSRRWGSGYRWMQAESKIGNRAVRSYFVPGDGNQTLAVFPELEMVVVFTAGNYGVDPELVYYSLFENFILPAVRL